MMRNFSNLYQSKYNNLLINAYKYNNLHIDIDARIVWGYSWPKTIVAPVNGAQSNHIRAYTIVEKPQIFFFSPQTNSVVHVVRMAKVHEIAAFDIIDDNMSRATR